MCDIRRLCVATREHKKHGTEGRARGSRGRAGKTVPFSVRVPVCVQAYRDHTIASKHMKFNNPIIFVSGKLEIVVK